MKRLNNLKLLAIVVSAFMVLFLLFLYFVLKQDVLISALIAFILIALVFVVLLSIETIRNESNLEIEKNLDASVVDALNEANVGVMVYNEDFQITWMSNFFRDRELDHTGEKILVWLPELQDLLQGNSERETIVINDDKYTVSKKSDSYVLLFKDITREYDLNKKIEDNSYVIGIVNYDNYDEYSESEDDISFINSNVKVPVIDYFKKMHIACKTLRNNRLLLIMNQKDFAKLKEDRFSILSTVRKEAKQGDLDITISMALAMGSENLSELDSEAQTLMEIAQTRGGDQVVVRRLGEEAVFYGGSSEAKEKQSKVKVRVMTNTLKNLINKSSNVIIVGHMVMDADCVGAAIGMSDIVLSLGKEAHIVNSGGIESMIEDVLNKYSAELNKKHHFISEDEALDLLNEDSLVIMVDHHSSTQSNGENILKVAKRIAIIDHHRRKADLDVDPLLIYVEAGSSSTSEMVVEFIQYLGKPVNLSETEANIIYLGIIIDTNHFRNRTGIRTFDVCKTLRQRGADPALCDELAEEPYEMVIKRSHIINAAIRYRHNVIVSAMDDDIYTRSIASQACDSMADVKEIDAAFVICNTTKDTTVVSARSNGNVNVQVVLEKMDGGGHMTAAGLQRKDTSVEEVKNELFRVLDEYFSEELENESNTAK